MLETTCRTCAAAMVLSVLAARPAIPPRPRACTIVTSPWIRDTTATRLIVIGTPDSVRLGQTVQHRWRGFRDTTRLAPETVGVYGQYVRVVAHRGPDDALLDTLFARRHSSIILVRAYDLMPDCSYAPFSGGGHYFRAGESTFVAARLGIGLDSMPTLDTYDISDFYPLGRSPNIDLKNPWTERYAPISAAEYFRLYLILPTPQAWQRDPQREANRLRTWARRHPHEANSAPMAANLWFMEQDLRAKLPPRSPSPSGA